MLLGIVRIFQPEPRFVCQTHPAVQSQLTTMLHRSSNRSPNISMILTGTPSALHDWTGPIPTGCRNQIFAFQEQRCLYIQPKPKNARFSSRFCYVYQETSPDICTPSPSSELAAPAVYSLHRHHHPRPILIHRCARQQMHSGSLEFG